MGTGKTTIGRALAKRLSYEFLDIDTAIQTQENQSITDIFEQLGEAYFRDLELKWCQTTLPTLSQTVIATGGGIVMNPDIAPLLRQHGKVVWLDCPIDDISHRLQGSTKRPLLLNKDIPSTLRSLYKDRYKAYQDTAQYYLHFKKLNTHTLVKKLLVLLK